MIIKQLKYNTFELFLEDLYINKDWELIQELTRLTVIAAKKQLSKLTVFEIHTNEGIFDFDIECDNYKQILESCIEEYSKLEKFEECVDLLKIKNKIQ